MATVGERLRQERESRGRTLEQIAEATGIGAVFLDALERDDFNGLPGRAFGKLYIRAYGEALQFDPQPLVDDYDREQRLVPGEPRSAVRWRPDTPATAPEAPKPSETPAAPVEPAPAPTRRRWIAALATFGIVAATIAIVVDLGRQQAPREVVSRSTAVEVTPAPTPAPAVPPRREATPLPTTTPAPPPPSPGRLSVLESGLGRRLIGSRLEDASDRFAPGDVAWFQTRVMGGRGGDTIRHVWIYDGRAQQAISLRIGGSDWRTQSSKTLYKTGPWSVEARDATGRVLASATFTCEAAPGTRAR